MQKSLVALSTIAALGLFACQPNTSDEAASTSADSAKTTSVSAEEMTDTQKQAYAMGASTVSYTHLTLPTKRIV